MGHQPEVVKMLQRHVQAIQDQFHNATHSVNRDKNAPKLQDFANYLSLQLYHQRNAMKIHLQIQ